MSISGEILFGLTQLGQRMFGWEYKEGRTHEILEAFFAMKRAQMTLLLNGIPSGILEQSFALLNTGRLDCLLP